MTRWINAQLGSDVSDLSHDLQDGLVLIRLINHVTTDSYILTPLYAKPTFKLQKVENVSDFLNFCRLVLKINICSISADDIVDGNSKLILGLIWSLFIYSSASTISINNECNSLVEVKGILLAWVNKIAHRKALPEICNFNKDWSLEINRPDLVFAAILDSYSIIDYNCYKNGKKLQNLSAIFGIAGAQLGIPVLAELDDFNLFAPDEKCVIFYLLEWFKYFEMDKKHFHLGLETSVHFDPAAVVVADEEDPQVLSLFLQSLNDAVKTRNRYETRALRLLNKLNSNCTMLKAAATYFGNHEYANTILRYCKLYLENFNTACANNDVDLLRNNAINFETFQAHASPLVCHILNLEHYALLLKPEYALFEFPELADLLETTNTTLDRLGLASPYHPSKFLSLLHLREQYTSVVGAEAKVLQSAREVVKELKNEFDNMKKTLCSNIPPNLAVDLTIDARHSESIAFIESVIAKIDSFYEKVLRGSKETHLALFEGTSLLPTLSNKPSAMDAFKLSIDYKDGANKSLSNMTFMDLNKLFKKAFHESASNDLVKSCILLIPNRTLVSRSDSDFNLNYPSDESDDSNSVFDGLQKKVGGQLMGNYDKVYDLNSFVQKIEGGFRI